MQDLEEQVAKLVEENKKLAKENAELRRNHSTIQKENHCLKKYISTVTTTPSPATAAMPAVQPASVPCKVEVTSCTAALPCKTEPVSPRSAAPAVSLPKEQIQVLSRVMMQYAACALTLR